LVNEMDGPAQNDSFPTTHASRWNEQFQLFPTSHLSSRIDIFAYAPSSQATGSVNVRLPTTGVAICYACRSYGRATNGVSRCDPSGFLSWVGRCSHNHLCKAIPLCKKNTLVGSFLKLGSIPFGNLGCWGDRRGLGSAAMQHRHSFRPVTTSTIPR